MINKKVYEIYSFSCVVLDGQTQITFMRVPILYIENYILKVSNIYVHLRRTILESCDDSHKKDCTEQRVKKGEERNMREKKRYTNKGKKYIYSVERANEFIQAGYHCIETGYNAKSHKFFWVFNYLEVQAFYYDKAN